MSFKIMEDSFFCVTQNLLVVKTNKIEGLALALRTKLNTFYYL